MITFNGIDLVERFGQVKGENAFIVRDIGDRGVLRRYTERQFIPNMPGSYNTQIQLPERHLKIDFIMRSASLPDLRQKMNELNDILNINKPAPVTFSDEPDFIYFGYLSWDTDWEELNHHGRGSFTLVCSDPYKYEAIENNVSVPSTILNDGTADTYPKFTATFTQPTTHFEIVNGDKRIRIGSPASMEQTPIEREELVFQDTMASTSSWQTASQVENGYIAGEMGAGSNGFYANLYGEEVLPNKWQGPSLKKAIGASLQDFRADIFVQQLNVGHETGMIEVYFLDVNDNVVAKLGVEDVWQGRTENQCKFQAGAFPNDHDIYTKAVNPWGWNDFSGILRVERIGNVWTPYFAQIDSSGNHVWRKSTLRYTDNANQYLNPITQVQVAIRKWPETDETEMYVNEIKIYRINDTSGTTEVPITINAGDVLEIDHANNSVLRNGEPQLYLADLASVFFPLEVGDNTIQVVPSNVADVTMTYRRRYL